MISYKDKLLFLSFKKILTTYLNFIESELNEECGSLSKYKNSILTTLSPPDYEYACHMFDDMLYQNKQFKQLINNINSEMLYFHSSVDFSLSLTSDDSINEISLTHLKKIKSLL